MRHQLDKFESRLKELFDDVEDRIENEAADLVRRKLACCFPGRNLEVKRDRRTFKISGDLSLGSL